MVTARIPRLDLEEVRAALLADVPGVLAALGWSLRREGSQLVSKACPARADHSRAVWKISPITGLWRCMSCGTSGDLFDVIAELERLDTGRDFATVLARAAALVGVTPEDRSAGGRAARAAELARRRAEAEARERAAAAARAAAAIPTATAHWESCARQHPAGERYLAERGLAAVARLVRFDRRLSGSPAIPLYTSRGEIRNVVRRRLPHLGEPKATGLYACPTAGTLLGRIGDIQPGGFAVALEGAADTLTAAIAWPGAVPLGAHGCDNLPAVVEVAARRCAAVGARMAIVPHNDEPGRRVAAMAIERARRAGIEPEMVEHGAKDLNDAWRAGWRPTR